MTAVRTLVLALLPAAAAWADDIRDIRGPKYIFPLWLALSLAAAGILLIAASYLIWRRLRRRPARALLPHEIALQRLEKTRPLMRPSTVREFSIAISDIVRGYIEIRFDVTATHLTTEEFLHGLLASSSKALTSHRELLAHFLEQCDMAKFAGMALSTPMMQHLFDSARDFITESAKAPPASDASATAAKPAAVAALYTPPAS